MIRARAEFAVFWVVASVLLGLVWLAIVWGIVTFAQAVAG